MRRYVWPVLALLLLSALFAGCFWRKGWVSDPYSANAWSPYFEASLRPVSLEGDGRFQGFKLYVKNKAEEDMFIEWDRCYFVYRGRRLGKFRIMGADPSDPFAPNPLGVVPEGGDYRAVIWPEHLFKRNEIAPSSSGGEDAPENETAQQEKAPPPAEEHAKNEPASSPAPPPPAAMEQPKGIHLPMESGNHGIYLVLTCEGEEFREWLTLTVRFAE